MKKVDRYRYDWQYGVGIRQANTTGFSVGRRSGKILGRGLEFFL